MNEPLWQHRQTVDAGQPILVVTVSPADPHCVAGAFQLWTAIAP